jgi:DNA-binding GntR family transcriptional regulator
MIFLVTARAATRTEQVYTSLRADIMSGRLLPGSKLQFADLTERYGVSMGAIREGLQRLCEQGLVVSEPQIGFRVMALSIDDLRDLTTARCEIEGLALRYAIASGDLAWESEIVASYHALSRTPATEEPPSGSDGGLDADDVIQGVLSEDWTAAHTRFHEALIAACPNQRIRSAANTLRAAAEVYRHWSNIGTPGESVPRNTDSEHKGIVDAVLARDTEKAVRLLDQHLRHTARRLIDRVSHLDLTAEN